MRAFLVLALSLLLPAAPVPPALRDGLIAGAIAVPPEALDFDRTTSSVRTGGGTTARINLVEHWNGTGWTLLSIAGARPTPTEQRDHERQAKAVPVPGYHRLAPLLAAATSVTTDDQGRQSWHVPVLPAGSVYSDSGDISDHLQADIRIARRGDGGYVDQLRITAREAFKMNMLIKVIYFEQIIDYQIGGNGKPRLISEKLASKGTLFGFPGGETAQVSFVYR